MQGVTDRRDLVRIMFSNRMTAPKIRRIVDQVIKKAEQGERWAIPEIFDRFIGKPSHDGSIGKLGNNIDGDDSATRQKKYYASLAADQQRQLDRFMESADD